jgi:hypothetical protein
MKAIYNKKFIVISILSLFQFLLYAQSNLTVFNNGDYAFHIMLNGIKQNQFPQKNVTISNISNGGHALKVVFANGASADIDKKLYLNEPSDIRMSIEFKKGVGKLKIISYEPTKGTQINSLAFRPDDNAIYGDAPVVIQTQSNSQNQVTGQDNLNSNSTNSVNINLSNNSNSGTVTNTTTTATTTITNSNSSNATPTSNNVNMNVGTSGVNTNSSNQNSSNGMINLNVGTNGMNMNVVDPITGQGINMNVNMNLTGMENTSIQSNSSSSTSTTTTTVTTSNQSSNNNKPNNQTSTNLTNLNTNNSNITVNSTNSTVNSNSQNVQTSFIKGMAKINCTTQLLSIDSYIKELKELTFESDQVDAIQKDLEFKCLTSSQAYKIVEILTFESNRLDVAKFLSDRMINRDKANELLPLFTFDSNKVEYKDYIK